MLQPISLKAEAKKRYGEAEAAAVGAAGVAGAARAATPQLQRPRLKKSFGARLCAAD